MMVIRWDALRLAYNATFWKRQLGFTLVCNV